MGAIICVGLYFFIAAVVYFVMYAKAYKRYKKAESTLEFKIWIRYEDLDVYCILWPFSILIQLANCLITAIEKIIKEKIDNNGN